jgi:hypothetical protein
VVELATIAKQLSRVNTEVIVDAAPGAMVQKLASHAAEGGSNFASNCRHLAWLGFTPWASIHLTLLVEFGAGGNLCNEKTGTTAGNIFQGR